jgi:multiple sugar transport system substrate-binding protein
LKAMRVLIISFIALMMLISTACSSATSSNGGDTVEPAPAETPADDESAAQEDTVEAAEEAPAEQVSIRFTWWGDTKRHEKYNAIADLFEKEHPNVKVVREFGSWNDYWDKLATQTAGGNAPDVVGMHATQVANYANRDALLDLTPYIDSGDINLNDFPQAVRDVGNINGKMLMVAQGVTMTGIVYNSGLLEKLGVAEPDFNWTWDQYADKLREVKAAFNSDGAWASSDLSSDMTSLMMFARQRGKNVFNEDGSLGVDKQDMIDWFTIWDNLRKEGLTPDAETRAQYANIPLEQSLFVLGKVAFTAIPYNQIPNYQNYITDGEVRALRRPTDPNGKAGEFIEGAYLSISKSSQHPKEAAQFISFFVNNEEAVKIFRTEQGALGSTKGNEVIKPLLDPGQQRAVAAIEETLKIAGVLPLPPAGQGQVATALSDASEALAFEQISVEQAADDFVANASSILAK